VGPVSIQRNAAHSVIHTRVRPCDRLRRSRRGAGLADRRTLQVPLERLFRDGFAFVIAAPPNAGSMAAPTTTNAGKQTLSICEVLEISSMTPRRLFTQTSPGLCQPRPGSRQPPQICDLRPISNRRPVGSLESAKRRDTLISLWSAGIKGDWRTRFAHESRNPARQDQAF
jgi:hypothetical protein